jgi:hypothetical protein
MPKTPERDRPEAGADTDQGRQGEGSTERKGDSGGHRSNAGGTYGDYVPDRGQPRHNDDLDQQPKMGDYYTGGGNIDRLAQEPGSTSHPHAPDVVPDEAGRDPQSDKEAADREERIAEANRNKGFDTTHVHSGTTTRKV